MPDSVALHDDERTAHWQAVADELCSRTGAHPVSVIIGRPSRKSAVSFLRIRGRRRVHELTIDRSDGPGVLKMTKPWPAQSLTHC